MDFQVIMKRKSYDPNTGQRLTLPAEEYTATSLSVDTSREKRPAVSGAAPPSSVTVNLCKTEQRRQRVGYEGRMLVAEAARAPDWDEHLPIVELLPFTKKEWRPGRSLPMERTHSSLSAQSAPARMDYESRGYPNPDRAATTPRGTERAPCPKPYSAADRVSAHPRHKEAVFVVADVPETPGFAPKPDRERSTAVDIRTGTSLSAHYSCNARSLTSGDLLQMQRIRVKGTKIDQLPPKVSDMYHDPWDYYRLTKNRDRGMMSGQSPMDGVYVRREVNANTGLDENIYDAFDRSKTLPSIKVKRAPLKKRPIQPTAHGRSSARASHKPPYRLGVTNTLDLLSHYGHPVGVEQHLASELKMTLDQLRRTKNNSSTIGGAFKIVPKYYDLKPTYGEKRIKSGIRNNAVLKVKSPRTSGPEVGEQAAANHVKGDFAAHNRGWMSRATTFQDSGMGESVPGTRSPTKSQATRVLSSQLQMYNGFDRENIEIPSVRMYKSNSQRDLRRSESMDRLIASLDETSHPGDTPENTEGKMSNISEVDTEGAAGKTGKQVSSLTGQLRQDQEISIGNTLAQQTPGKISAQAHTEEGVRPDVKTTPMETLENRSVGQRSSSNDHRRPLGGEQAGKPSTIGTTGVTNIEVGERSKVGEKSKGEINVTLPIHDDASDTGSSPRDLGREEGAPIVSRDLQREEGAPLTSAKMEEKGHDFVGGTGESEKADGEQSGLVVVEGENAIDGDVVSGVGEKEAPKEAVALDAGDRIQTSPDTEVRYHREGEEDRHVAGTMGQRQGSASPVAMEDDEGQKNTLPREHNQHQGDLGVKDSEVDPSGSGGEWSVDRDGDKSGEGQEQVRKERATSTAKETGIDPTPVAGSVNTGDTGTIQSGTEPNPAPELPEID